MISRMLKTALLGVVLCVQALPADAQNPSSRYRVAACDWMMLKRQKLGAFALAKDIGADGVELDMGPLGKRVLFDNKLRDGAQALKFKHVADSLGIEVPSIAMSGFFAQNFITRDNYYDLVSDCLETARRFGSKVIFLPLGGSGQEWKQKGSQRDTLVSRLRVAGTLAQAQGVTIGIRTQLPAKETVRLLKDIGSPAVKVYYNFQDAADNHRCIVKELKQLGKDRIVQIHASNTDSVNLREDPEIDLPKIKKTLDEMGWNGWLVVERSRDANHVRDVRYNFGHNVAYIKEVFK